MGLMHHRLLYALTLAPMALAGCAGSPAFLGGRAAPAPVVADGQTGRDLLRAGRIDEAIEALTAAAPSGDWRVLTALGAAFDRKGDHGRAQFWHRQADTAAPNNPTVLNNWALSLAQSGQREEARSLLRRAAALPGAPAQVQANLRLLEAAPDIIVPPQ